MRVLINMLDEEKVRPQFLLRCLANIFVKSNVSYETNRFHRFWGKYNAVIINKYNKKV